MRKFSIDMRGSKKGLTLIEVMVTLALVTIIVSIGYYSLRRGLVREKIRGAAQQLHSDLLWVRQNAFARSEYIGLIPFDQGDGYKFVKLDSLPSYFDILRSVSLPGGIKFGNIFDSDISGAGIDGTLLPKDGIYTKSLALPQGVPAATGDNWILFTPRGTLAWGKTKYIYLTNGRDMYGIKVTIWGKVEMYVYDNTGGGWNAVH